MADRPPAERKPSSRSQPRRPSYREALGAAVSKKVLGKEARDRVAAEEEKKKKQHQQEEAEKQAAPVNKRMLYLLSPRKVTQFSQGI